jgi:hypothetical protein
MVAPCGGVMRRRHAELTLSVSFTSQLQTDLLDCRAMVAPCDGVMLN